MPTQIVTTDDLQILKNELVSEFKALLKEISGTTEKKETKWIKSPQVRRILNISPGSLQHLRITGIIPYTKMGGTLYYDYDDIQKILTDGKTKPKGLL